MNHVPHSYTDEQGNAWTLDALLTDLDRGDYLYLTPKMCADLAKHLRQHGPSRPDKDGERYRFLRECAVYFGYVEGLSQHEVVMPDGSKKMADVYYSMETLDAAVDKAINSTLATTRST